MKTASIAILFTLLAAACSSPPDDPPPAPQPTPDAGAKEANAEAGKREAAPPTDARSEETSSSQMITEAGAGGDEQAFPDAPIVDAPIVDAPVVDCLTCMQTASHDLDQFCTSVGTWYGGTLCDCTCFAAQDMCTAAGPQYPGVNCFLNEEGGAK
jgi:hypothetical protein